MRTLPEEPRRRTRSEPVFWRDAAATRAAYLFDDADFTGGGQVGCNFAHTGPIVFGVEGDFSWSGLDQSVRASYPAVASENPAFTVSPRTDTVTSKMEWYSTARIRGGWLASERMLLYITGGVAVANFKSATNVTFGTAGAFPVYSNAVHIGSDKETRFGLSAGAGVEYAFWNNWSLKAEYLLLHFTGWNYSSPLTAPAGVAAGYAWNTNYRAQEHIARVGLNYRFGSGPVVARY